MNLNDFLIANDEGRQLCKLMFKILHCNSLWITKLDKHVLSMLVTDRSILEYYWDKKYYLCDPNFTINKPLSEKFAWQVSLGTDYEVFNKNGFLHDLYKLFIIEEFVSIERNIGAEQYCFRFFTKNNRFIFMNKLLNDLPIIKCFINAMIKKFKVESRQWPGISLMELT